MDNHNNISSGGINISHDDMRSMESMCRVVFTTSDEAARTEAGRVLDAFFHSSVDNIPFCLQLLETSRDPYLLQFVSSSLLKLIRVFWRQLVIPAQPLELRDRILSILAKLGPNLPSFVLSQLLRVLSFISRTGWRSDPRFGEIVSLLGELLNMSVAHCAIGLRALADLVDDMNSSSTESSRFVGTGLYGRVSFFPFFFLLCRTIL
jgi:hypothetical protein